MMRRRAVFLDRDGTMVREAGYLRRREDLAWFPWTVDAIRLLNRAGFAVCVTTNQGGIALGYFSETFVRDLHGEMAASLDAAGARVDGWFFCPHHPSVPAAEFPDGCPCRKPRPGMLQQAAERLDLDLSQSFSVGDRLKDVELIRAVGGRGVLVRTGYGAEVEQQCGGHVPQAAFVADDLMGATAWILAATGHPREGG